MKILNTRPAHQSEHLTYLIEKNGSSVFHFPLLEILPVSFNPIKVGDFDYIIFLSANAVHYFFGGSGSDNAVNETIIAIGSATKHALTKLGFNKVICPTNFSSDGILKMREFQNCKNKSIAIISGENPKPLLSKILRERGAILKNIFCYCRKPITYDMEKIFPVLQANNIDIIITTSAENLLHLMHLFQKPNHRAWLLEKKLCVINEKMKTDAFAIGFKSVIQAENATDEMIAKSMKRLTVND
ncbi:MAG TPA: uroporphyrinogen-III synthase [Coxiellaceae bacterium]|nr:MAG: hypothetical protein A3E81_05175 [Gammaproteobacteria bacterium RIFCSPHIGHO2_12_FULL_36_30]HLB55849.1 uroporphyrinogen-III synthase [Coxiellaceae bacterium]